MVRTTSPGFTGSSPRTTPQGLLITYYIGGTSYRPLQTEDLSGLVTDEAGGWLA